MQPSRRQRGIATRLRRHAAGALILTAESHDLSRSESKITVQGREVHALVKQHYAFRQFEKGQLQEVRIYPIWARQAAVAKRSPMTAPEIAQRILQRS